MTVKLEKTRSHQIYKLRDGTRVPGASTIAKLGDDPSALINWAYECGLKNLDYRKVRDNAADIGTLAHFMIESHLKGVEPDMSEFSPADVDKAENAFLKFLEFWQNEKLTIIEPEVQLVSETYKFGGTIDAPSRDGQGRMTLLDWKTSSGVYDSMICQLAGYEALWNENRPTEKIERRGIIRIGKKEVGDVELRWLPPTDRYFDIFKAQLALYYAKKAAK